MMSVRSSRSLTAFFLCLFLSAAQLAMADKVALKTGKVLEGVIVEEDSEHLRLETKGAQVDVRKSDIISIERTDRTANALARGDTLLKNGFFSEAIAAYREALTEKPEEAKARIAVAEKKRQEATSRPYANLPPEQAEKQVREALQKSRLPQDQIEDLQTQLANALVRKADDAAIHFRYEVSVKSLEEAWTLRPDLSGVALKYAQALEKRNPEDPRIKEVMDLHLAKHPDDIDSVDLWVRKYWKTDPWATLRMIYPKNELHIQATSGMKEVLPEVLLACFNKMPYPADAPFDRASCYERYMTLNPEADRKPLLLAKLEKNPDDPINLLEMARYEIEKGRLEDAQTQLEDIHRKFPEFKDAKMELDGMKTRMLERDIQVAEKSVDEMTTQLQKAINLTEMDFPLSPNKGEWVAKALGAKKLVDGRPERNNFPDPQKYLEALEEYKTYVTDNGKNVAMALGQSDGEKKQVEMDRQREQALVDQEKRIELNRRRDELLRSYLFGEAGRGKTLKQSGSWSKNVTDANGAVLRELYYKELKIYARGGQLELYARNVHLRGDAVLSGDIITPSLNQAPRAGVAAMQY